MITTEGTAGQAMSEPGAALAPHALLAALSAAAAAIHFSMIPAHSSPDLWHGLAFAAFAWFQAIWAILALTRPGRSLLVAGVAGNLAILAVWAISRTVGVPGGPHSGEPEQIAFIDALASSFEALLVAGAAYLLLRPATEAAPVHPSRAARLVPALGSVAALLLATAALASPSAREGHGHLLADDDHSHGEGAAAGEASAHDHGDWAEHGDHAEADLADSDRCDLDLNPASYWEETEIAGVDTVSGGGGGGHDHGGSGEGSAEEGHDHSGHDHGTDSTTTTVPTASDDRLAALASQSGEGAAARLVVELSQASDAEYRAWLQSLDPERREGAVDDNHGAGGHLGPQPWQAMTDPATCEQLREEIEIARQVALDHPTAADATAAGYVQVTTYVPGIAAHYMNFRYVDGTFEVDKPEMLLYDGNGPDANVIGLSYYIVHPGDEEPTQGFTGLNDHYHRHVGLCVRGTMVIGDTTTTQEECEAMGGRKQDGTAGWMSHAWVVPGCESPWGIFSAANPILDGELGLRSGQGEPCSGSGVLDRYELSPGPAELD